MRRSWRCPALASALLFAAGLEARADQATNLLEPVAWLVGTWAGTATAADGTRSTVEAIFAWADHGKLLEYAVTRRAGDELVASVAGVCGWHPGQRQIVLWEIDADGSLTEATVTALGDTLDLQELVYAVDGTTLPVRARTVREGDDAFLFLASVPKDGSWTEVFRQRYERVRPPAP